MVWLAVVFLNIFKDQTVMYKLMVSAKFTFTDKLLPVSKKRKFKWKIGLFLMVSFCDSGDWIHLNSFGGIEVWMQGSMHALRYWYNNHSNMFRAQNIPHIVYKQEYAAIADILK